MVTAPPTNLDPEFDSNAATTVSVVENTPAGENIGDAYTASHADSVGTLAYSIDATSATNFDIESATGQLKTKTVFDFETDTTSYTVTVSVSDGMDDYSNTDTAEDATIEVTISVTNVNEGPAFADDAPATQEVAENTAAETDIGSAYTAIDPESDTPLIYSLGGADAASFAIDTDGQLKTLAALDHEDKGSYSVDVQVSDGKDAEGTAEDSPVVDTTHSVAITVTDEDEDGSITFSSDPPSAGTALTATLSDDDGVKTTPAVAWAWESSTDQSNWTPVTGADTNSITLGTEDIGNYYKVTATYDDEKGSGKTATGETTNAVVTAPPTNSVAITVTDEDEDGSITFSSDPPSAGTALTATLSDDDGVKTTPAVAWAWESSTDQSNWTPVTGADTNSITLGTEDIGNYYKVTATYDDEKGSGKTATGETTNAVVTAPPTNLDPEFDSNAATTVSVVENTPAGENIGDAYTASHADSVGTLAYSIDATSATNFDIESATGQLKTKTVFDFETDTTSYTVTVSVSDGMDDYSNTDTAEDATIEVTISVTNVNEGPAFADDAPATLEVAENTAAETDIGSAYTAIDPESDTPLIYSLGGADAASFAIDTDGQLKTLAALDHEDKGSYSVDVQVSDGKDAEGTAEDSPVVDTTHSVAITVTDEDEDGSITFSSDPPSAGDGADGDVERR